MITAAMVESAAADVGGEFRDNYSGRGMYGRECVGIVAEGWQEDEIINSLVEQVLDNEYDGDDDYYDDARDDVSGRMSSDSMGLSAIFYFRGVQA